MKCLCQSTLDRSIALAIAIRFFASFTRFDHIQTQLLVYKYIIIYTKQTTQVTHYEKSIIKHDETVKAIWNLTVTF